MVSLEAGQVISTSAGALPPSVATKWIGNRPAVVVAVERGPGLHGIRSPFQLQPDDVVYLSGTLESIGAYFVQFPTTGAAGLLPPRFARHEAT
jgi:hypothetical protein